MRADIIGGMSRAEGYMVALANIVADREICGDSRQSFTVKEAEHMSVQIRAAINYVTELESQVEELKEELSEMRLRHPDELQKWVDEQNTESVIAAGR